MEHVIVFFLAGFVQFMTVYGAMDLAAVLFFALLIASVSFVGAFALLTVLFGMVFGNVLARTR